MGTWKNNLKEVMDWSDQYDGPPFHALLSDAPYEIGFMNADFDKTGISFRPETWGSLARHLFPGGYGFVFGSSRCWHKVAAAIEQAGMVIHPTIFGWGFATGYPRGARIDDERFHEHRYGLQALKPSVEPIICFQKPFGSSPLSLIQETGAGTLNIFGNRAGLDRDGRLPSNLVLIHSPECVYKGVTKIRNVAGSFDQGQPRRNSVYGEGPNSRTQWKAYGDTDHFETVPVWSCVPNCPVAVLEKENPGTSRFYIIADWTYEVIERLGESDQIVYCPKADRKERDAGLDHFPDRLFKRVNAGGLERDPKWQPISVKNFHPMVKPLGLTRHLASLLLPPASFGRRLLVPFAGSGSEMIGALLAGWDYIEGIEKEKEYSELADARLTFWGQSDALKRYSEIKAARPIVESGEPTLFSLIGDSVLNDQSETPCEY